MTSPLAFFPRSQARPSARAALWAANLDTVAPMLRQALAKGTTRSRKITARALDHAMTLALNGAHFLLSGDAEAGRSALAALDLLGMLGCEDLARLADTIATLIAGAQRRDVRQARVCGQAVQATYPSLLGMARNLWTMAQPVAAPR